MLVCCQKGVKNATDKQNNSTLLQAQSRGLARGRIWKYPKSEDNLLFNTKFFVDDGISGVTFEREGLQELLREVEFGNVSTVITKDLSTLGRNYLKLDNLLTSSFQSIMFGILPSVMEWIP